VCLFTGGTGYLVNITVESLAREGGGIGGMNNPGEF
jgi:hypothetical protein